MKTYLFIFSGLVLALFIVGYGAFLFRKNQPYWELHFIRYSETERAIEVMLDGESYGRFVFDKALDSKAAVIVITEYDVPLPFGEIRFADLTWPPGRVVVEVNGEVLDITRRGVERRSSEWVNPPHY